MDDGPARIYEDPEFHKLNQETSFEVILDHPGRFYRACIGDKVAGFRGQRRTRTLTDALAWLRLQARTFYPDSDYVQSLKTEARILPFRAPSTPAVSPSSPSTDQPQFPIVEPHGHPGRRAG
jgi:hypothetical protein